MFPIDEPRFEIDANTREISIPVNFKKLVGVQGDHVAETLIFAINRFVDYYDLLPTAANGMQIYVQWKNEAGEDILTPISMIHYEASSQKILFGWPLTSTVTVEPRTIDFSIRFIVKNGDTVVYSLNTKTHQVTIVKALQPNITASMATDSAADSFLNAIKNSPSTDAPPAADPSFATPGINLPKTKDCGNNADELVVQAVVNGLGYIDYTRWTKNGVNVTGQIKYRNSSDDKRVNYKTYYTKKVGAGEVYEVYTGSIPAEQTLYERFYVYPIPADPAQIVGTYKAYAVNKTSNNISAEVGSAECVIPGPSSIEYAANGDLAASSVPTGSNIGVALSVKVNKKDTDTIVYEWKYDSVNRNMSGATTIPGATGSTYSITDASAAPGYYQVIATPKRNRASGTPIFSTVCRVTGQPSIPKINTISVNPIVDDGDITNDDLSKLTAEMTAFGTQESDSITYKWYGKLTEGAQFEVIEPANAAIYRADEGNGKIGFNTASLYVYGGDSAITYTCVAKNTLNGQESAFGTVADAPFITLI